MEEGTLSFVADHPKWKAIYRTRVRPDDDIEKFITFAAVIEKEAQRKMEEFLIEKGAKKDELKAAVEAVKGAMDFSKKDVTSSFKIDRSLKGLVLAWAVREALKDAKIPYEYKKGKIKPLLKKL
jgi:hypothetical protein